MTATLETVFRTLASFDPPQGSLAGAPWEQYADWAIANGLAPLAAYNLEYRLGSKTGAPEWVRDRLMSIYQGSVNDNVMKLVNFKRAVDELEGRQVVLVGAASFAESLYAHVAFRPVIELHVLVQQGEVEPFARYLQHASFRTVGDVAGARELSDGRTSVFVHGSVGQAPEVIDGLIRRSLPMKAFGPSVRRLELEDALLTHVAFMARAGFEVPLIEFVDVRELVLGAPSTAGVYSRAPRPDVVLARAAEWRLERALFAALSVTERLFPEVAAVVRPLTPPVNVVTREILERLVVGPASQLGRDRRFRGEEALRALLAGG